MPDRQRTLTATEIVVADLAVKGRRNRQIAHELGVAPEAVEQHLACVYGKLGVRSRAELIARAAAKASPGE